ncbi:MAG: VWA domain-containing protein, partial [Candidatus Bathyarchaeota archaeon]|nr:VWA domain-containing protein [Candidatus Termiticorpusculum sp.]
MNKTISFNFNNSHKQKILFLSITCLTITLLLLTLFITTTPTAYGDDTEEYPGVLIIDKTASPNAGTDENANIWMWDITVSLRGLDLITTSDIVLVIDTSGSMANNNKMAYTKTAANAFVDNLLNGDGRTRIALVTFATDAALRSDFTSDKNALHAAINGLTATGSTHMQNGIRRAHTLLAASTANNRYIVLLGDGEPTFSARTTAVTGVTYSGGQFVYDISSPSFTMTFNYGTTVGSGSAYDYPSGTPGVTVVPGAPTFPRNNGVPTIYEARLAKDAGFKIYSIAVVAGVNGDFVLQSCASDGSCFYKINNNSQGELAKLTGIFTEIAGKILYAASNAVVTDPIGAVFDLVDADGSVVAIATSKGAAVYNSLSRVITWNIGNVEEADGIITMTYTVKIDTSKAEPKESYATNGRTFVTYTDVYGTENQVKDFLYIPLVGYPQIGGITKYIYLLNDDGQPLTEQDQVALDKGSIKYYDTVRVENPTPVGDDPYVFEYGTYQVTADTSITVNGEMYMLVPGDSKNFGDNSPLDVTIDATNQQARVYFAYQKPQVTVTFTSEDESMGTVDGAVDNVLTKIGVIGTPLSAPTTTEKSGYQFKEWIPSVPSVFPSSAQTYTAIFEIDQGARFSMVKTVDGVDFSVWFSGYTSEEQALVLDGMSFRLYADSNGVVDRSVDFAVGKVDGLSGLIDFVATRDVIAEGWYWVVEDLTGS